MNTLREIFSETQSSRLSLMRVMSFIALLVSIVLSFYCVSNGSADKNYLLIISWLVGAFFPKALQKFAEQK